MRAITRNPLLLAKIERKRYAASSFHVKAKKKKKVALLIEFMTYSLRDG